MSVFGERPRWGGGGLLQGGAPMPMMRDDSRVYPPPRGGGVPDMPPQPPRPPVPPAAQPPPAQQPQLPPAYQFLQSLPWGMQPLDIKALLDQQMLQAMMWRPQTTASPAFLKAKLPGSTPAATDGSSGPRDWGV